MMYLRHEIKRFELSQRDHARLMRDLNRETLQKHSIQVLPKHFESNPQTRPGGEYNYRARSVVYTKAKRKKYSHARPNVYSGELLKAILANRKPVRATQYRATMTTRGTSEHRLADWQRREVEYMSIREREQYAKWQGSEYARRAFDLKYAKRKNRKA